MKQLSDFSNVEEARSYTTTEGRMLSNDMVIRFLAKHRCVSSLQSSDDESAMAFYLAVQSSTGEYNLMDDHHIGVEQQDLLEYLVSLGAVNQGFADDCIAYANQEKTPYSSVTKHEFELANGTVKLAPVTAEDGWVTIHTTDDCEPHNPRLVVQNPRTGKKARINSFYQVSEAGAYDCQVPAQWRNAPLFVDDTYGVIS